MNFFLFAQKNCFNYFFFFFFFFQLLSKEYKVVLYQKILFLFNYFRVWLGKKGQSFSLCTLYFSLLAFSFPFYWNQKRVKLSVRSLLYTFFFLWSLNSIGRETFSTLPITQELLFVCGKFCLFFYEFIFCLSRKIFQKKTEKFDYDQRQIQQNCHIEKQHRKVF